MWALIKDNVIFQNTFYFYFKYFWKVLLLFTQVVYFTSYFYFYSSSFKVNYSYFYSSTK